MSSDGGKLLLLLAVPTAAWAAAGRARAWRVGRAHAGAGSGGSVAAGVGSCATSGGRRLQLRGGGAVGECVSLCRCSCPPCAQRRGAPMACHRSTVEGGGGASAGGGRHCSATTAATAVAAGATCRSDCPGDGRGRPGCGSPNAVPTAWPACGNRAPGPRRSSPLGLPRCHDCQ